jgi:hypothetical protein
VLASDFAGFDCWMVLMILLGSDLFLYKKKKKRQKNDLLAD